MPPPRDLASAWTTGAAGAGEAVHASPHARHHAGGARARLRRARLYRTAGDGQLVWRGTSETFDPANALDLFQSVNPKVLARMRQDGVL
jgi:hypothetical protein